MRARKPAFLTALFAVILVLTSLGGSPAQAAAGKITCKVTPSPTVTTKMDTRVTGRLVCTHSKKQALSFALVPFRANKYGPDAGVAAVGSATGNFAYIPGYYPPDPVTGKRDRLPDFTGPDKFTIHVRAKDGATRNVTVNIRVVSGPRQCDPTFVPDTRTMFNDPSGNETQQYQMLRHLIKMIDCTPAKNPDGSRAYIRFSFYSLTYAPVQAALTAAAKRGVVVQALTNSHADKYGAWKELAKSIGTSTWRPNFAATCWQGCLTPRTPPVAGGPTAWYSAEATSLTSKTVVFRDRSLARGAKIVSWKWNFGDGKTAKGKGPKTHKYKKYGNYKTKLTVKDAKGRTHTTVGEKTLPDEQEPEYPSLHSKVYLFSTVGTGKNARRWVTAYSSGNPTYQQSRKGFNNLNITVGDKALFSIFNTYYNDLVRASRGQLLTRNYFRTFYSPGNKASAARATTVHLGPQTDGGDINRDILQSIRCLYKVGNQTRRTDVKVSMFVLTRKGVAADLWRLAMRRGCNVEVVYTQMSQKIKGVKGSKVGAADCLSAKPTKVVRVKGKRKTVPNDVITAKGKYCTTGSLKGRVPVTSSGVWVNRTSPYGGGRLIVRMSCPVAPKFNPVKQTWAVVCIRNDIFTHNKALMVAGFVRGKVQKYVMSGSSNWSSPGLRASDEVITEIQNAGHLYDQYVANYQYLKTVVSRNSRKSSQSQSTYQLSLSEGQTLDVRGMTDEQLAGQE